MGADQTNNPDLSQALRQIAADCFVAGQIAVEDLEGLQRLGIQTIINNRPDHEAPNQPTHAELQSRAQSLGLAIHHLPLIAGTAPEAQLLANFKATFEAANKPVLAFCRSGTRSSFIYASVYGEQHD